MALVDEVSNKHMIGEKERETRLGERESTSVRSAYIRHHQANAQACT